jgi:hypothetical protein
MLRNYSFQALVVWAVTCLALFYYREEVAQFLALVR